MQRKHPLANCEDCPLYIEGKYVPSVGPDKAEVAFVGEAPGAQEAKSSEPFTGPSGRLLDIVMTHHGIKREEVLLTNACLCRPPGNETPDPAAVKACRPRLVAELAARGVSTAVALGNSASLSLLEQSGVTKLRIGPGRSSPVAEGVRVISTLHPAAALRQGDFFPHIVTDIGKVTVQTTRWVSPTITVADTEEEALSLIAQVDGVTDRLSVDIEVGIEKDVSFDHPNNYDMLCVGLGYAKKKVLVIGENAWKSELVREAAKRLLLSKLLIMQNGKFDMAGLYPSIGKVKLWFDTMLASYTFDERPGIHGLEYLGVEYLGAPNWKDEIKQYLDGTNGSYANIPRHKLYKYNGTDASVTWDLAEMFEAKYETNPDLRRVHDFLVAAANELMFVEMNGIKIDRQYLLQLQDTYLDSLEVIRGEINEIIGYKQYDPNPRKIKGINPNSPKQVTEYLFDQGIRVDSTDVDTITMVMERVEPDSEVGKFCKELLKHRKEAKLYGTYVKGIRKRMYGGRVHPTFNLHGTTTGRLACRNPNLQNIPRGNVIRTMFVPSREENVFVHVDYGQAELRVLTWLAQDSYFQDIFNSDEKDVFDELTPVLYPEAVKPGPNATYEEKFAWKELRIRVKAYVYGLGYGREARSIADEFSISVREAITGMNAFFGVIPDIVKFREETRRKVLDGEELVTPWGRHRRFTLITKENKHSVMNEALAFLPQSTASDMTLHAFTQLRPALKGIGYVRNLIHDAILAECHEEDAEEVSSMIQAQMLQSAQLIVGDYVKFKVDATVGKNWGSV